MAKQQAKSKNSAPHNPFGIDRTIVLVGLMGAGKTTVGRRLAKHLDMPFVDSDHEIEKAAGMSVAEIFECFGEADFRSGERRVIERLLDGTPKIVATGGGAFVNEDTRQLIKKQGLSIWLDADISVLVDRTARRDTRPLLKTGDPAEILTRLSRERSPFYAQADIKISSNDGPHEDVIDSILRVLETRYKTRMNT